jgi:adenosylhomocysteine nucleosidase
MVRGAWVCSGVQGNSRLKIAIIAALPGELKPLVRNWKATYLKDGTKTWTYTTREDTWIAACSGMGANAARRAFAGAEANGAFDIVLSVGWAGALEPELRPGDAHAMSMIIDAQTGEQFQLTDGERKLRLVTTAHVADADEKARLRTTYCGAVMVDMEAATIARLAQMRGIPLVCIKGVSDGVEAKLPDINPFISPMGQLRLSPFLAHLAVSPRYWGAVGELGRNSSKAAQSMCDLILEFMKEKNVDRINRTGSA